MFDFAALSHRVLIELDGGVHNAPDVALRDATKQEWAEAQGYRVMRLKNVEVEKDAGRVLERVRLFLNAPHPLAPSLSGEGE